MIEELPSVAVEALLDHVRANHAADNPTNELDALFKELRGAYLKYGERGLRVSQSRENRLFNGLTGNCDQTPSGGR